MSKFVTTLKFTGIVSLGLLTGVHINFSTATLQTILSLASARTSPFPLSILPFLPYPPTDLRPSDYPAQAQRAFTLSLALLRQVVRPLEMAASGALVAAWCLAGRGGRHPYLLLTAAMPLLGLVVEKVRLKPVEFGVLSADTGVKVKGKKEADVNGEVVRGGLENWRRWGLVKGGVVGVGFGMGVMGIWGDGV